jgi:hypothetical protein
MAGFEVNIVTTADGLAALYAEPNERILINNAFLIFTAPRTVI